MHARLRLTLCDCHGLYPPRLLCPWNFPGKNTGVSCYFFLQGIFLTRASNPHLLCLLYWQTDFTTVSPGKPNYFSTVIIKYRNSMKYLLQFIILQQEPDFKNLFKNCNITLVSIYKFVLVYIFTERSVNKLV